MKGALIGSSQLKFLTRDRLFVDVSVKIQTFSYPGATAARLTRKVRSLPLQHLDFIVLYIGGNDLQDGKTAHDLIADVSECVEVVKQCADHVFLFRLMPQLRNPGVSAEIRRYNKQLAQLRQVASGDVTLLNVDHKVLTKEKKPKPGMLAGDGYHIAQGRGLSCIAGIISSALTKRYGPWIKAKNTGRISYAKTAMCCDKCGAKGHANGECRIFLK